MRTLLKKLKTLTSICITHEGSIVRKKLKRFKFVYAVYEGLKRFKSVYVVGKDSSSLSGQISVISMFPAVNILRGGCCVDSKKQTILLVSHEASRTGAPILTLNIARLFVKSYDVVILLLGEGELVEEFQSIAIEVILDPVARTNVHFAEYVISEICKRHQVSFALVNSAESRGVLLALALLFVPTVSLLHEFASYTRPRSAFLDIFLWSTKVVFSTQLTLENALSEYKYLKNFVAEVIPQGKCETPNRNKKDNEAERLRLTKLVRPEGKDGNIVVVLGAGTVEIRKGVDLFIACASRVLRELGKNKCRFVWVGNRYDPDNNTSYSVYLADQLERSGLKEHVVFTGETSEIEFAYTLADMFLISARLDPLPNVAIDALYCGLPVLCFDKTTGIADFLKRSGLGDSCVASYLDVTELSQKILAFVNSTILRKEIGDLCRTAALATFCMQTYVSRIEKVAFSAGAQIEQEKFDVKEILTSSCYVNDFLCPQNSSEIIANVVDYIHRWRRSMTGIPRRKLCPGFHPGIYLERHGVANEGADPFADYLRNGKPQGSWSYPVINDGINNGRLLDENLRVAIHLHVYYPDLLLEIMERLENNEVRPDLFISVKDQVSVELAKDIVAGYSGNIVDIRIVPNKGRDIGPLLTSFGEQLVENYDIIGHLHTKQSFDVASRELVSLWRNFLLENLLGGKIGGSMADAILSFMDENEDIGIVFPDDPHALGWDENRFIAEQIAPKLGMLNLPNEFNFPTGSMFWVRAAILKRLVELDLTWDDYPLEPLPCDGTMLHALERLFGLVGDLDGMRYATTNVPGVIR